jgi:ArsR family transcriptional regulator
LLPNFQPLIFFSWVFKKDLTSEWAFIIFRYMSNFRDDNIEKFAEMFKALSNPNRLKIFMRLVSCCIPKVVTNISSSPESENCACIGELGQDLNIVASTMSHHIKELRQAGLIRMERRGQKIECWIDPETLTALQGFFSKQTLG